MNVTRFYTFMFNACYSGCSLLIASLSLPSKSCNSVSVASLARGVKGWLFKIALIAVFLSSIIVFINSMSLGIICVF